MFMLLSYRCIEVSVIHLSKDVSLLFLWCSEMLASDFFNAVYFEKLEILTQCFQDMLGLFLAIPGFQIYLTKYVVFSSSQTEFQIRRALTG